MSQANYKATQKQLESSKESKTSLGMKLIERDAEIEALTNELTRIQTEFQKAQKALEVAQKVNLDAKLQIIQNVKMLDESVIQAEAYKKQSLQLSEERVQLKLELEQLKQTFSQEIKKRD